MLPGPGELVPIDTGLSADLGLPGGVGNPRIREEGLPATLILGERKNLGEWGLSLVGRPFGDRQEWTGENEAGGQGPEPGRASHPSG